MRVNVSILLGISIVKGLIKIHRNNFKISDTQAPNFFHKGCMQVTDSNKCINS